jgi:hypothetical protein
LAENEAGVTSRFLHPACSSWPAYGAETMRLPALSVSMKRSKEMSYSDTGILVFQNLFPKIASTRESGQVLALIMVKNGHD